MRNPFILAAIMAATMIAAFREKALREFYGKGFHPFDEGPKSGHGGSKRPRHIVRAENRRRNHAARLARRRQRA